MWQYKIDVFIVESEDPEGIVQAGTYLTLKKGEVKEMDDVVKALKGIAQINPSGVLTLELKKVMPVKVQTGPAPTVGVEQYGQGLSNAPTNEVEEKAPSKDATQPIKTPTVKETPAQKSAVKK